MNLGVSILRKGIIYYTYNGWRMSIISAPKILQFSYYTIFNLLFFFWMTFFYFSHSHYNTTMANLTSTLTDFVLHSTLGAGVYIITNYGNYRTSIKLRIH